MIKYDNYSICICSYRLEVIPYGRLYMLIYIEGCKNEHWNMSVNIIIKLQECNTVSCSKLLGKSKITEEYEISNHFCCCCCGACIHVIKVHKQDIRVTNNIYYSSFMCHTHSDEKTIFVSHL